MSLINKMLQDIEKRQSDVGGGEQLPSWVPAAVADKKSRTGLVWLLIAGLLILVSASWFLWPKLTQPTPTQEIVAAPVAVVVSPSATVVDEPPIQPPAPTKTQRAVEALPVAPKTVKPEQKSVSATPAAPKALKNSDKNIDKVSPDNDPHQLAEQHYQNALAFYAQGRTTESLAQSRLTLVSDPGHLGARQLLLRQLVEQGDKAQALVVLREGLQRHPEQITWSILEVRLEMDRGDLQAARLAVEQASPQASGSADFQSLAGAVAQRQGRLDEAADHYRSALRIKPAEGRNWIGLGLALEGQGHTSEAQEAFRRALGTPGLNAELQALAQRKSR